MLRCISRLLTSTQSYETLFCMKISDDYKAKLRMWTSCTFRGHASLYDGLGYFYSKNDEQNMERLNKFLKDVKVRCFSLTDLLSSKKAVGRPQDQGDIEFLMIKLNNKLI